MDGTARALGGVQLATSPSMNRRTDGLTALMERYAAGDDEVFDSLYGQLSTPLYRFCLRLATNRAEADDLFQETFLKLHRARGTYMAGSNALHWSYAIARSLYVSGVRYWRRRPEKIGDAADISEHEHFHTDIATTPEAEVVAEHLLDIVTTELRRMSEKNRVAYVLLKEEGLSARDAAVLLGTTSDVVKQRAHRAYESLKSALREAGWKEES
jgi:RNA polymerase sigma-70 factor, ECF subfamily